MLVLVYGSTSTWYSEYDVVQLQNDVEHKISDSISTRVLLHIATVLDYSTTSETSRAEMRLIMLSIRVIFHFILLSRRIDRDDKISSPKQSKSK